MTVKSTSFNFSLIRAFKWSAVSCGCRFIVNNSTTVTVGLVDSLMWSSKACMSASELLRSLLEKSRFAIHLSVSLESAAVSSVRQRSRLSSSSAIRWILWARMCMFHLSFHCLKVDRSFSRSKDGSLMLDGRADSCALVERRLTSSASVLNAA